jgi:hypothetical protein
MKIHNLNSVIIDGQQFYYFQQREKNDVNGNPRYKVFITDPDAPAVYETIFKCYHSQITERVTAFIENTAGVTVPF